MRKHTSRRQRHVSTSELRPFYSWGTSITAVKSYQAPRKTIDGIPDDMSLSDFLYVAHNKAKQLYHRVQATDTETIAA